jgi:hypothetical protein
MGFKRTVNEQSLGNILPKTLKVSLQAAENSCILIGKLKFRDS